MKNGWISTQSEMAQYCGMCTKTFIKLSKKTPIPKGKVGAIWKTTPEMLDEWLKKITKA